MEYIKERKMTTFVLSSLANFVVGLAFGLVVGIIATVVTRGAVASITMGVVPFALALLVAFTTHNIYRTYFYYQLSLDVNAVCKGDGQESESYLLSCVLNTLTGGLYGIYWIYKLAQRLRANAPRYGFKMMETGKDIAVMGTFSFGFISTSVLFIFV